MYMNTIGDMRNEMDFYGHYNMFEYNHDYVKFYEKVTMHYWNTWYLYKKDYYKFLFFRNVDEYM